MTRLTLSSPKAWTPVRFRQATVIALTLVLILTAAAAISAPARASSTQAPPHLTANLDAAPFMRYVQVNSFKFDPLAALPAIPPSLSYGTPSESPAYYIVQFGGPVTPGMKASLAATGSILLYYINYNAFVVRADRAAIDRANALPAVRWTGLFEPAYKLSPRLSDAYEARLEAAMDQQLGGSSAARAASILSPPGVPALPANLRSSGTRSSAPVSPSVTVDVLTFEAGAVPDAAQALAALGGSGIVYSYLDGGMLRATVSRGALASLAQLSGVMWIDLEAQPFLFNDIARWVIQSGDTDTFATPVHDHGIYGTGQTVTLGDSGLDYQHKDFADPSVSTPGPTHRKVTDYYVPPGATGDNQDNGINHGTHTSGTIAGDDGTWHVYDGNAAGSNGSVGPHDGQAFDAKIQMQDISDADPWVFPPSDMHNMFQPAVDRGSWIHSDSWGGVYGDYIVEDQQMDDFIWNNQDFIVTFAAGNPGSSPGLINPFSVAKNVISVGATLNGVGLQNIADFSGRGPATDGRLKPDVMAPGVDVWSARGCDPNPPCNDYWQLSGTSMATPTVAGAATLVRQYYMDGWYPTGTKIAADAFTPSGALVKATLINGATEMNGAGAYINGEQRYPNDNQGWGRILLDNALYFAADTRSTMLDDHRAGIDTGTTVTYLLPIASASEPIEVTLAWSDYPGAPMTSPNLVNDLDLTVTAPDGTVYKGNQFAGYNPGESVANPAGSDHLNNVEGVLVLSHVETGVWTVDVKGYNVPMGPQPFAVVMTGAVASNYGVIGLNHHAYQSSATVGVRVADTGLNADPVKIDTAWAWINSTTETSPENITLTETAPDTAVFQGSIPLDLSATPIASDGLLQVQDRDTITASYFDANDGMGGSGWRTATAVVDDTPPAISGVAVSSLRFNRATITWTTDELSNSSVVYGTGPPPGTVVAVSAMVTSHVIKVTGLAESTTYVFEVRSTDAAGNTAVDDNGTHYFTFTTPVMPPTPLPNAEWPTFHNNEARLGVSESDLTPPLTSVWVSGQTGGSVYSGPVLKDGLLFATSEDGYIRARDPYDGSVVWSRALGTQSYYAGIPVVDGGVVYTTFAGQVGGTVYALDAATGDTLWSNGPGQGGPDFFELTAMAHADGLVFGNTYTGQIYALYDTNGSVAWNYPSGGPAMLGVTVASGLVFEGTMARQMLALDELTGALVWSQSLDGYAIGPPVYLHGSVYVATVSGSLYNLDAFTGEVVWQTSSQGGMFYVLTPATDGRTLYLGMYLSNYTGAFLAMDATTGEVLWTTPVSSPVATSVAYANGYVYGVSTNGTLWSLRASDGTIVDSEFLNPRGSGSTPAVSDGWVWVDDLDGVLHAFRGRVPVGLVIEPAVQTGRAVPSSTMDYRMTVENVGTLGADTFDATATLGPLGWSVGLYYADGVTPLSDTDSDGVPDTGSLASGASISLDVRVTVPGGAALGDRELSLVTFTSSRNATRSWVARLTTLVPLPGVDVGPRGYLSTYAGATVTWNMTVDNLGGGPDTIEASASSIHGWAVALLKSDGVTPLPDTDSDGIPDTGVLPGLTSTAIVVRVQVPSNAVADSVDRTLVVARSSRAPTVSASSSLVVELAAAVDSEWPQFHHDRERSGVAPVPFQMPLSSAWNVASTGAMIDRSAVAIHDHTAFYADSSGAVSAVDLGTGVVVWRQILGLNGWISGGPALAYGNLYVTLLTGNGGNGSTSISLFSLDPATGSVHWHSDQQVPYYTFAASSTPSVAAGSVFWSTNTGRTIYATDALTGQTLWSYGMLGWPGQGPTYWGGMVYATDDMGALVALDAVSGTLVWSVSLGSNFNSAPTVANGMVYVGGYNNVYAVEATTGEIQWTYTGPWYTIDASSMAVAEGLVFVAAGGSYSDGWMSALDANTGFLVWSSQIGGAGFASSPAYNNGTVFEAGTSGYLYAWDAKTGSVIQTIPFGFGSMSSMAVADGYLVFGDQLGRLDAFAFVGAGVLTGLSVIPGHIDVPVTGAALLTGTGVDAYGNFVAGASLTWTTAQGLGSLVPVGTDGRRVVYMAGSSTGADTVSLTSGAFSTSASVSVLPGAGDHVVISPDKPTVDAGGTLVLRGAVTDRFGNPLSGSTVTWSASPSAGTVTSDGVLTASTFAGTGTVTATSGAFSTTVTVTIVGGPLASVTLSLASANPTAGSTNLVAARDAYGNPTGSAVTWSVTAGTVSPLTPEGAVALYLAPTTTGPQRITATAGARTASASVTVVPGPLAFLSVSPGTLSIAPGGTANLELTAEDAFGNAVLDGTFGWSTTIGSIEPSADRRSAIFTAGGSGSGTVTVTSGGKSAVVGVVVYGTILEPATLQNAFFVLVAAVVALTVLSVFLFWKLRTVRRPPSEPQPSKKDGGPGESGGSTP